MDKLNSYDLSRNFWNFAFDNPEKINPTHCAIYFFAIEHCNRLGWRNKFGFPTMMVCDAVGIRKPSTYIRYFNDLIDWGFFTLIEKSKNQYSANIISLTSATPKNGKALDKAMLKHRDKHGASTGLGTSPIDKQLNNLTTKQLDNDSTYINYSDFKPTDLQIETIKTKHNLKSLSQPLDDFKYQNEDKVNSISDILKHFKNWIALNEDHYKETRRSIL